MTSGSDGSGFAGRLAADLSALDKELAEIDLLITQATAEAERHEQKRSAANDRLAVAQTGGEPVTGLLDQANGLVALTRRAAVMEAQVDVLAGKRKVLGRYRDALAAYQAALPASAEEWVGAAEGDDSKRPARGHSSRVVLAAQEDLRREIARAIHDGPAQSLSNIVLQAQIVERIVQRDPSAAGAEVRQLIEMVQRTLDATKSFIFDVRPMVLDDLGLVPTLRGAARDRGRRSGIPVAFESFGPDRRLSTELESGLFRVIDDALAAYLSLHPEQVSLGLEWGDQLEARIMATPSAAGSSGAGAGAGSAADAVEEEAELAAAGQRGRRRGAADEDGGEVPPALAQLIAQRRDDELAAQEKARHAREIVLPASAWEDLRNRAETLGLEATLLDGGSTFQVAVDLDSVGTPEGRGTSS
jgi:hypothetical protein